MNKFYLKNCCFTLTINIIDFMSALITSICSLGSAIGSIGIGLFVSIDILQIIKIIYRNSY